MFTNRCSKIITFTGIFVFSIMLSSLAADKTEPKKGEGIVLSPSGTILLEEKIKGFPAFDENKVKAEAEEKFILAKVGDKVTVRYRRGQATGILMELDNNSIRVDEKRIIFMDMAADEDARFIESKCKALRSKYMRAQQNIYDAKLKDFLGRTRRDMESKYPVLGKKTLNGLFSKIKDETIRDTLSAEFAVIYDKSLPLEGTKQAFITKIAEKFAAERSLSFNGKYFKSTAEMEEEKKQAEVESRRMEELHNLMAQRANDRFLLPKTASPMFKPDGGLYAPKQKVELYCPTPDATIYYTLDGGEPTEASTVYTEPITVENPHIIIKAKAFHPLFNDSEMAVSARFQDLGSGLYASYFDKVDCTGKTVIRVDRTVDFDWGTGSPDPAIPAEYFSAMWVGSIIPKFSETYKFYITIDNGARLWIGDSLLIDHWVEDVTAQTAEIKLTAGTKYDIKVAFCETWGFAKIKLEWSSPSVQRQVIPQNCLYPEGKYVDSFDDWNHTENGVYVKRTTMVNPLSNGKTTVIKLQGKNPSGKDKIEDHITK